MIRSLLFKFAFSNMNNSYNGFLRKNTHSYDWHHVSNFKKQHLPVIKVCRYINGFLIIIFLYIILIKKLKIMIDLANKKKDTFVFAARTKRTEDLFLRLLNQIRLMQTSFHPGNPVLSPPPCYRVFSRMHPRKCV